MAKKTKKRKKAKRQRQGREVKPPKAIEIRQRKRLLAIVSRINRLVKKHLIPKIRALEGEFIGDSKAFARKQLINLLNQLNKQSQTPDSTNIKWSESFVKGTDKANERTAFNMFKGISGIDLKRVIMNEGIAGELKNDIKMNVGLIKSIPETYFTRLTKIFEESLFEGKGTAGSLIEQIQALSESTKTRAEFIARDQTATITGKLNERRSENLGSPGYKWINSRDVRVRGNPAGKYPNSEFDHWHRHNKYYLWKSGKTSKAPNGKNYLQPPADGNPGVPIACRCTAVPVIPVG